jgi:hypothetical protein
MGKKSTGAEQGASFTLSCDVLSHGSLACPAMNNFG